jgi:hypothetical protein
MHRPRLSTERVERLFPASPLDTIFDSVAWEPEATRFACRDLSLLLFDGWSPTLLMEVLRNGESLGGLSLLLDVSIQLTTHLLPARMRPNHRQLDPSPTLHYRRGRHRCIALLSLFTGIGTDRLSLKLWFSSVGQPNAFMAAWQRMRISRRFVDYIFS